jgi:hypothetical protein
VYFTHFHLDLGRLVKVDCQMHIPFSTTCIESYPLRIWFFIMEVKGNMEKVLNDIKQYQICQKMIIMKCSLECWSYLCSCLRSSDAVFFSFDRKHADKFLHCHLSLSSSSTKNNCSSSILTQLGAYSVLEILFSITFGI